MAVTVGFIVTVMQSLPLGVDEETDRVGILPKNTLLLFPTLPFEFSLGVTGPLMKWYFVPDGN